jgi:hypothetical protein
MTKTSFEDVFRSLKVRNLVKARKIEADNVSLSGVQALTAAGAINVTSPVTTLAITGSSNVAFTLPNGEPGQMKIIKIISKSTGDAVITPATFHDGTTLTFDTANEAVILVYHATLGWMIASNNGGAVA